MIVPGGAGLRRWNAQLDGPEGLLPLDGHTLLTHQCRWLALHGIEEVWVASVAADLVNEPQADLRLRRLDGRHDAGTAGCLRDARASLGSEPFLVVYPNLVPLDVDLEPLLDAPREQGATDDGTAMWALVAPEPPRSTSGVSLDSDVVREFVHLHPSQDRRRGARALGVFLCGPEVLEHVPDAQYFDLEEQLVPALRAAGRQVRAVFCESRAILIESAADYLLAVAESLYARQPERGDNELQSGVWTRGDAEVSRSASLVGPVVVDRGAVIDEGALIVGPTYVGSGVEVAKGARVRQASLWANGRVGAGASVAFSVLAEHQQVGSGETLSCVVRCGADEALRRTDALYGPGPAPPSRARSAESPLYPLQKRLLDVLIASVGLLVTLPLWGLIAVATLLDSGRPVFFRHRRCGRFGIEFYMLKFRTMQVRQEAPRAGSERRGPIYKHSADARITRVGSFLRWTSLDELPQLWNILRGEMTLVGPRPLEADEMLYNPQWRDLRLSVKPGLTGLWQLHARRRRDFESWIHYDSEYVLAPPSVRRDLEILVRTAWGVIKGQVLGE